MSSHPSVSLILSPVILLKGVIAKGAFLWDPKKDHISPLRKAFAKSLGKDRQNFTSVYWFCLSSLFLSLHFYEREQ